MADQEKIVSMLQRIDPIYLAGLFDGEGSVCSNRQLNLKVNLTQANEDLLLAIAQYVGCGNVHGPRKATKSRKGVYDITWCGKNAEKFLEMIKDYVIVKRHQVELCLQLVPLVGGNGTNKGLSQENREAREVIMDEIRIANDSPWSRRKQTDATIQ